MKSTGIVRQLDNLGRIVLPMELRRTLQIEDKAPLEIFTEGNSIILRKYTNACIFCGQSEHTVEYRDHYICADCLEKIKQDL